MAIKLLTCNTNNDSFNLLFIVSSATEGNFIVFITVIPTSTNKHKLSTIICTVSRFYDFRFSGDISIQESKVIVV